MDAIDALLDRLKSAAYRGDREAVTFLPSFSEWAQRLSVVERERVTADRIAQVLYVD